MNGEIGIDRYTLMARCIVETTNEQPTGQRRQLYPMPCGTYRRRRSKGRDVGTRLSDSLCRTAEMNTTLESNYTPIKLNGICVCTCTDKSLEGYKMQKSLGDDLNYTEKKRMISF